MVRKKKKEPEQQGNGELFLALALLEKEKGIPVDFMLDKIKKAIATACKNNYGNEEVEIEVDPGKGKFEVFLQKQVVEEVEFPEREIRLDAARAISPLAEVGGTVGIKLDTKQFGRVAAQTARNIIRQGIRDSERGQMMQEFQSKHQELVSGLVERVDPRTGAFSLRIGKAEAVLPKNEQVGQENVKEGDYIKVYVVDVKETEKGPKAIISRTHPDLVKRMFETEVPEIYDGTVEIKAVSREAGSRTKLAVQSHNPDVDAVGACIGARGARVNEIVEELGGEKRLTLWSTARSPRSLSRRLCPRPVCSPSGWKRRATSVSAGSQCRTASSPWPLATRGRTPAWLPSSLAGRLTSGLRAVSSARKKRSRQNRKRIHDRVRAGIRPRQEGMWSLCGKRSSPCGCAPAAER